MLFLIFKNPGMTKSTSFFQKQQEKIVHLPEIVDLPEIVHLPDC